MSSLVRLGILFGIATAVACGGAATQVQPAPRAGTVGGTVTYEKFAVSPQQVSIKAGEAVAWTNKDGATHTITSGAPSAITKAFDTKQVAGGASAQITFDKAGSYDFFCEFHQSMRGQVLVK